MLPRMEKKIISWLPQRLAIKYSYMVRRDVKELHELFDKIMKDFSMQRIIKIDPNECKVKRDDFYFKRQGN